MLGRRRVRPATRGAGRRPTQHARAAPVHPYADGDGLVAAARAAHISIGQLVLENEAGWSAAPDEVPAVLDGVWQVMRACIDRGLRATGKLPGGLGLRRRARDLLARVEAGAFGDGYEHIARAQAYAYAVNEENAAGGRVVTAPTNGAAGIVPAVLAEAAERYGLGREAIHRALATAGAFGGLIKQHASLSGAEVGCQGEVGSATAMAAAALCELLGGDPDDVEYAAEIGMEHNLGLTCDPLKGLVQAPCIERNAMGVAKAWSAAQLALHAGGDHLVSFDRVIQVMKRTGDDMRREYKETGEGGLAVFPAGVLSAARALLPDERARACARDRPTSLEVVLVPPAPVPPGVGVVEHAGPRVEDRLPLRIDLVGDRRRARAGAPRRRSPRRGDSSRRCCRCTGRASRGAALGLEHRAQGVGHVHHRNDRLRTDEARVAPVADAVHVHEQRVVGGPHGDARVDRPGETDTAEVDPPGAVVVRRRNSPVTFVSPYIVVGCNGTSSPTGYFDMPGPNTAIVLAYITCGTSNRRTTSARCACPPCSPSRRGGACALRSR